MQHKTRISSNFFLLKIVCVVFMLISVLILAQDNKVTTLDITTALLLGWVLPIWILYCTFKWNIVEYDGEHLYRCDSEGRELERIPLEKVSAMLFSGFGLNLTESAYKFFYVGSDGKKRSFFLHPSLKADIPGIQKAIQQKNPRLIVSKLSFGGLEHLIWRDEKWFR